MKKKKKIMIIEVEVNGRRRAKAKDEENYVWRGMNRQRRVQGKEKGGVYKMKGRALGKDKKQGFGINDMYNMQSGSIISSGYNSVGSVCSSFLLNQLKFDLNQFFKYIKSKPN